MKRWYIFFVLVGILVAMGGLGVFGGTLQQQTTGQAGAGKFLFLTMLGIAAAAYATWLAFSSSARKRRMDAVKDASERHPIESATHAEWQQPPQRSVEEPRPDRTER